MTTTSTLARSTRARRARRALAVIAAAVIPAALTAGPASATATATAASEPAAHSSTTHRGSIVSVTPLARLSTAGTRALVDAQGIDTSLVSNGVATYRLVYRTVGVHGEPTTASGLVALPRTRDRFVHAVAYTHGTMSTKSYAPSSDDQSGNTTIAAAYTFAGAGNIAVAPDYLGLGVGPGRHPYMHARTEASASIDLLRAARSFSLRHGRVMRRDVRISGFSQGGAAAMALARAVQRDRTFRLAALAPISGPYDVRDAEIPAAFDGTLDPVSSAYYFAYYLDAYDRIYDLFDRPQDAFRSPYAETVGDLFDGTHEFEEILASLPGSVPELLTPAYVHRLQHPTGRLARAIAANDNTCSSWVPRVPVRLIAAHGDREVALANSLHCRDQLRAHGARVSVLDLGDHGHFATEVIGVGRVVRWFDALD